MPERTQPVLPAEERDGAGEGPGARLERQLANREEDLRAAKAAHAVTKGKLTKTRNRIAKGVCPCCNRSFVNLGKHMAGQHPDFGAAENAGTTTR